MATLTPTLTLTSTDATSDSLSLSVTDTLTVGAPSRGVSTVVANATGKRRRSITCATRRPF